MKLKSGFVYYLKDFTAPKVFNGLYFECLLTDQKIAANEKVKKELCHITEWEHDIYKPERFNLKQYI